MLSEIKKPTAERVIREWSKAGEEKGRVVFHPKRLEALRLSGMMNLRSNG
jgi:hypothetical protein